ncbi:MAG: hypothetical protein KDB80_13970, partial [Planctomycetes bacterium]|nr:hypothetical protein [Planctomycetota bacterium]
MKQSILALSLLAVCTSVSAQATPSSVPGGLSATQWSGIRDAYEAKRHEVRLSPDGGFRAEQPRQGFSIEFDGRGFTATSPASDWRWGLELVGYGREGRMVAVEGVPRATTNGGRLEYHHDENLAEWYRNEATGFEHGFTLTERPVPGVRELRFDLQLRGGLRPTVLGEERSVRFDDGAGRHVLDYAGLVALDADGTELPARIESTDGCLRIVVDDLGARYPLTIDPAVQLAYLKASNAGNADMFGQAVAVFGDTVVVTAHFEDSNATGVNGDEANNSAGKSGAAYVFVQSAGAWSQQAYLKASNAETNDQFGWSVAISGDTIVVGAIQEDSSATTVDGDESDNSAALSGAAYVFVRTAGSWSQEAYLKANNAEASDQFGWSVGIHGDEIVVGAPGEDGSGLGTIGDPSDNGASASGAAYVFHRSSGSWSQIGYLKASNTGASDAFGEAVAITNPYIVVGAKNEDSAATGIDGDGSDNSMASSGAAYVYYEISSVVTYGHYLKASNTNAGDLFGKSVAIDGATVVVGATGEDSSATGVDGDETDGSAANSGAAYVFDLGAGGQQAYLKASNTDSSDLFGQSVAVSSQRIVVGAFGEDSATVGVESDNSASSSGAAYLFERSGSAWSPVGYLKASNTEAGDLFGGSVAVHDELIVIGATS